MIEVDIGGIWGEVSLPDLLKMEYDIFQAHLALEETELAEAFDVRSYNNPVWLYVACRRMMEGCGRKEETLVISGPELEAAAKQWQAQFGGTGWVQLPGDMPEPGFVTVLHRGEGAADALLADLADRSIPVVSIAWDGAEGEPAAFFRLAKAISGRL